LSPETISHWLLLRQGNYDNDKGTERYISMAGTLQTTVTKHDIPMTDATELTADVAESDLPSVE